MRLRIQRRRIGFELNRNPRSIDVAMISLMKRRSMGVAMDERILDQQFVCTPRTQQNSDTILSFFRQLGSSLIDHPVAIDSLMHSLFLSGGRKSMSLKMKCA